MIDKESIEKEIRELENKMGKMLSDANYKSYYKEYKKCRRRLLELRQLLWKCGG